jgi:hypothetical protein
LICVIRVNLWLMSVPFFHTSECKPQCQLQLPWIADPLTQKSVEVEEGSGGEWVDVVLVVESIEHLNYRDQRIAFAKPERPLDAPVK